MSIAKKNSSNFGWWISGVFVILAISFVFDFWGDQKIIREHPPVDEKFYSTDPVRDPYATAQTSRAGFAFGCNECHRSLEPPETPPRKLIGGHEGITLHHEEAMTCYTCHSKDNREKLNDIYGVEVTFEESENLCRRCHGPRFRDWKLGIHGRMSGVWDQTKGEKENITCVYCHNPHEPKFQSMRPSPPPSRNNFITGNKEDHHE